MSNGSGLFSNKGPLKPHLLQQTGGLAAEINDLRKDAGSALAPMAAITVDEFINPPAADVDAIKLAIASDLAAQSYSGAALDGVVGVGTMSPPRTMTTTVGGGVPADAPVDAEFVGVDIDGNPISEVVAFNQVGGTTAGTKAFARVTRIDLPAGDGVGALLEFGFGDELGLSKSIKTRAGLTTLIMEIEDGVKVTTGVVIPPTTVSALPHGTYLASNLPDGARDYALYFEYDPTA